MLGPFFDISVVVVVKKYHPHKSIVMLLPASNVLWAISESKGVKKSWNEFSLKATIETLNEIR